MLIEMSPELIVTFGIDNNPTIDNLTKSGLKVFIQADWMEQTGKAEWIMLYGELFGKEKLAKSQFDAIVKNYNDALALVASKKTYSNCFIWLISRSMVCGHNSWVALFKRC
jgi:iron complex transport system substrate-binding protein